MMFSFAASLNFLKSWFAEGKRPFELILSLTARGKGRSLRRPVSSRAGGGA